MMKDIARIKKLTGGKQIITKSEWMIAALDSLKEDPKLVAEEPPA
jgi:hypothetical protein